MMKKTPSLRTMSATPKKPVKVLKTNEWLKKRRLLMLKSKR